jgi:AcrR family transcriptional regulator
MVLAGGLESLTMQALAREMDAAVGTAYTYFASKSALVAELEVIALQRTLWAFEDALPRWMAEAGNPEGRAAAEYGLLALGEFGVRAPDEISDEYRLQQLALTDGGRAVCPADQEVVLDAASGWTAAYGAAIDRAVESGAIHAGPGDRLAAVGGLISGFALFRNLPNSGGLDVADLTRRSLVDLFVAWGGDRNRLEAASARLSEIAGRDRLRVEEMI